MEKKSLFTLSVDELKAIVETGTLPEDVSLEGMSQRPDFEMLFKMRSHPEKLAKYLLGSNAPKKERKSSLSYVPSIPLHVREEKIRLKQAELEIKRQKLEQSTTVLVKIEEMNSTLSKVGKKITAMEAILKRLVELTIEKK